MNKHLVLKKRIKKNEGFKNTAYFDSLGFLTIGYGHLIKKDKENFLKEKFSKKYLYDIFIVDFNIALKNYLKVYEKENFSNIIKEIFIEMIFQLGIKKQKKFIKMIKYIKNKCFFMAAFEMKNSLWYKQTPKRVEGLIKILLKKEYEKKR